MAARRGRLTPSRRWSFGLTISTMQDVICNDRHDPCLESSPTNPGGEDVDLETRGRPARRRSPAQHDGRRVPAGGGWAEDGRAPDLHLYDPWRCRLPGGVAVDRRTGFFYVGSTTDGTIFRGRLGWPSLAVF